MGQTGGVFGKKMGGIKKEEWDLRALCQVRDRTAVHHFSILRELALKMLGQFPGKPYPTS